MSREIQNSKSNGKQSVAQNLEISYFFFLQLEF